VNNYSIIHDTAVLDQALALCRGRYQRNILLGNESLSGSTLSGKAKTYGGRYKASAASILRKCQQAGLAVREETGRHGKRLVVVGFPTAGDSAVKFTSEFDKYACPGDTIRRNLTDAVAVVARLEFDQDTNINDFECYEAKDVRRWKAEEWYFGGIVLSVEVNGETVRDHVASLWGIDVNFGQDNGYLAEVANDLLEESKNEIRDILDEVAKAASDASVAIA
jgi:hypothetical protein